MTTALKSLLSLLELEKIETDIYRGYNRDIGSARVFGGQVFAQALVAARKTVEQEREAHSVHGYFILPGDLKTPIVYFVDRLRDGASFCTRRVTAIQNGKAIFNLSASFHKTETGITHQSSMPEVAGPETLVPELDMIRSMEDRIPEKYRQVWVQDRPIDFRPLDPLDPFNPEVRSPHRKVWFRTQGSMPDSVILNQAVLAYASDYGLLPTALQPHGISFREPGLQMASLDHSLWLHRPFRSDEWLLYCMDSPTAYGARGFTRGSIYSQSGDLVASVAQEGLVRI